jgi:hypothetical protein
VFKVYVTGASSSDSCAIKLYSALVTVILPADKALIEALASVIAYILASSVEAGAAASESACAADLPAVLLSVASVYCSQNEHMPTFYNSFTGFITTCTVSRRLLCRRVRGPDRHQAWFNAALCLSACS